MSDDSLQNSNKTSLSFAEKFWVICGHVHMDLCSAVIFTHLLVYLSQIVGLSAIHTGIIFFIAQKCDALIILVLKNEIYLILSTRNGRRVCHISGTLIMLVLIPLIFHPVLFDTKTYWTENNWAVFFYYLILLMISSLGHSAVYMSNMAEIVHLNIDPNERRLLYHLIYGTKYVMTMVICLLFYFLLCNYKNDRLKFNKLNDQSYEIVSYILTGLGAFCSILFQLKGKKNDPKEPERFPNVSLEDEEGGMDNLMGSDAGLFGAADLSSVLYRASTNTEVRVELGDLKRRDWLKIIELYPVTLCYMFGKLMVNITQVYCILYLVNFIDLDEKISNLLAFVIQFGGVLATPLVYFSYRFFGHKGSMAVGLIFASIVSACYGIFNIDNMDKTSIIVQQLVLSMLLGVASTFLTLPTHDLTVSMSNEEGSINTVLAFINFTDKLSTGLAILLLQISLPKCNSKVKDTICINKLKAYYKYIMFGFPAGCSIIIFALLCAIIKKDLSSPFHYIKNTNMDP